MQSSRESFQPNLKLVFTNKHHAVDAIHIIENENTAVTQANHEDAIETSADNDASGATDTVVEKEENFGGDDQPKPTDQDATIANNNNDDEIPSIEDGNTVRDDLAFVDHGAVEEICALADYGAVEEIGWDFFLE